MGSKRIKQLRTPTAPLSHASAVNPCKSMDRNRVFDISWYCYPIRRHCPQPRTPFSTGGVCEARLCGGNIICANVKLTSLEVSSFFPPRGRAMQLAAVVQALNLARYFAFAATTIAVYDWILLLGKEVELVGNARMSIGKALFYLVRITTIPGLLYGAYTLSPLRARLNQDFCNMFLWISPILCLLSIFISYWLLTIRVVVLYPWSPLVKIVLYISLGACYLTSFGVLLSCLHGLSRDATYVQLVDLCMPTGLSSRISIVFEAPLVFEGLMFAALIYRAAVDLQSRGSLTMLPLFRVLYRDGILFFVIMTSTRIWNIYKYVDRPIYEALEGLYIMWSIVSVLSCRIYINIICAVQKPLQAGSRSQSSSRREQSYSLWEFKPPRMSNSVQV